MSIVDEIMSGNTVTVEVKGVDRVTYELWEIPYKKKDEFFVYWKSNRSSCKLKRFKPRNRSPRWYIIKSVDKKARVLELSIAGHTFAYRKDAEKYIRDLANTNSKRFAGDDEVFLLELLNMHPNREKKIGCGLSYIFSTINEYGNGSEFRVVRTDGSIEDFSYYKILDSVYRNR